MKLPAKNVMTPTTGLTRRVFLRDAALLTVATAANALPTPHAPDMFVQTVLGPIPSSKLGVTLAHCVTLAGIDPQCSCDGNYAGGIWLQSY
jgi:hypothetical protein